MFEQFGYQIGIYSLVLVWATSFYQSGISKLATGQYQAQDMQRLTGVKNTPDLISVDPLRIGDLNRVMNIFDFSNRLD